jgi:hypothetical protein
MEVSYIAKVGDVSSTTINKAREAEFVAQGYIVMVEENLDNTMVAQADGTWAVDMSKVVDKFTIVTDKFISDVLNDYNTEHGIKLQSVHNCESYSRKTGYTHQAFCQVIWEWSVDLWEAVRGIVTIPTDEEFEAVVRSVTNVELQTRLDRTELRFK